VPINANSKSSWFNLPLIAKPIRTKYWRPSDDFRRIIVDSVSKECVEGDIVVVSEKAISVAMGRVVDESQARPGSMAKALAWIWMRLAWGRVLGPLCHMSKKTLRRLRYYPIPEGEAHKQTTLRYAGFGQSLLHYSEGGIDVTNLPYALAALPLSNPGEIAIMLRQEVKERCGKNTTVMITDTDKTYSRKRIHITPRPCTTRGIRSMGVLALILGRALRWTAQATPLAVCGLTLDVEEALSVADVADRARGFGAGRTAWDMARRFHVGFMEVTWEMLDRVEHYPIVIIRRVD
jgi:F420-0:gamma-glutamyl ligase-like protein